ncbi:MAG: NlpC/P60 family protein, partial [Alsobacter sp.]
SSSICYLELARQTPAPVAGFSITKGGHGVRVPQRGWTKTAVVGLASLGLLLSGTAILPSATAAPSRDIAQVRDEVRTLQSRAEAATERYNSARNELADVQDTLAGLQRKVKRERAELQEVLSAVDDLARATYTSGGIDTSLQVLLAEDPTEFLAQAAALDQVAQSQASSLRRTQTARLRLAQSEAAVEDKESIAQNYRDEMSGAKSEAEEQLGAAENILANLEEEERQRLAALAEEERRQSQAAASAASAALNQAPSSSSSGSGPSSAGGGYTGGGRAAAAVSYALAQVGNRYVAAAAGPDAFDCSGLTMTAWRQSGVSLPHYSYSQYSTTRRIPTSEAQPGDLVFYFGSGAHHVGLYIGGGKMVHAANPGDGVRIDDIMGPWYGERFSGIGRVVG